MLRFLDAALSAPANPGATRLIQGGIDAGTVPAMNVFLKAAGPVDAPCLRLDRSYTGPLRLPMPCPWLRERSF